MPTIQTDTGEVITLFTLAVVEIKDTLDDAEWTPTTHLFVDKLTLAVNAYDTAELTRFIGDMIQPGDTAFATYPALNLLGKYVRITITQEPALDDIVWVGYINGMATQRSSVKGADPDEHVLTGKQQGLVAVGLEWFLDRVQIDRAVVYEDIEILRSIPFNGGQGVALDADTRTREP